MKHAETESGSRREQSISGNYTLDSPSRMKLALAAGTTDRSIKCFLIGRPMKPVLFHRIADTFRANGLAHLIPAQLPEGSTG
jgi:hypothetical protein